jgi:hypothetical protein
MFFYKYPCLNGKIAAKPDTGRNIHSTICAAKVQGITGRIHYFPGKGPFRIPKGKHGKQGK